MNSSIIWRIVWKDFRTYRSIWLTLFGISVIVEALVAIISVWNRSPEAVMGTAIVMALGMPVVYAVAVSSVAFSQEHEVGTFGYLQSLPIGPFDLFVSRTLHALIGALAMFIGLFLLLPMLLPLAPAGARLPAPLQGLAGLVLIWASMSLLAIAIGTFCSLLTKHPLAAALITAFIVCVIQLFGMINTTAVQIQLSAGIAIVVLLIDVPLARGWLVGGRTAKRSGWLARRFDFNTRAAVFRSASGRLIWVHLRRLALAHLVVVGCALFMLADSRTAATPTWLFIISALAGALGVSVFYVDQRDRAYRIYAEHGVSPRLVWVVRHAVGLILLLFVSVCIHFAASGMAMAMREMAMRDSPSVLALTLMPLLAYCCGQLMMLLTRSPLIAIFVSLTLSLFTGAWCWMAFWLQVPWFIAALPLPVALMIASWVYIPTWILERDGVRPMAAALGIAVAGVVVTVVAVSVFRVVEIPAVVGGLASGDEAPGQRTMAQKASEMHLIQAADLVDHLPATQSRGNLHPHDLDYSDTGLWATPELDELTSDWLESNQVALAKIEAAFEQTDQFSFPKNQAEWIDYSFRSELYSLNHLLVAQGRHLQAQGELGAAWEKYRQALEMAIQLRRAGGLSEWLGSSNTEGLVYDQLIWWASSDEQSVEAIQQAVSFLSELSARYPDSAESLVRQYQKKDRLIRDAPDSLLQRGWSSNDIQAVVLVFRLMPWERVRSRRALRFYEAGELEALLEFTSAINDGRPVGALLRTLMLRQPDRRVNRSMLVRELTTAAYIYSQMDATVRNRHRAAILQLALIAWKKQHGHYPDSLTVVDQELDVPLLDVFTGQPFVYFAEGKEGRLLTNLDGNRVPYPARHPFLWSPGQNLKLRYSPDPRAYTSYQLWLPVNSKGHRFRTVPQLVDASAEELVWQSGTLFGLPAN